MAEERVFDVDRLRARVAGRATINAVKHDVLQVKGGTYQGLRAAKPIDMIAKLQQAVAECVPTLTADEVADLNTDQLNAIVGIAGVGVEAVEQMYPPNAESPAVAS